ncbi:MAG: alpha/beta fold hydrolase [Promethearchaeota archaeon]
MPYFTNADQNEIYYELIGKEEDLPIILLIHGYGSTMHLYDQQIPMLEQHFRILRFDFLGSGKSDKIDFSPEQDLIALIVRDISDLLKNLNFSDKIGIVAHGFLGCGVALEFIQKNKSIIVNFLILLNGCPFFFRNIIQITFWNLLPQGIKQNFKNILESELQTLIGRTTPLIIKILNLKTSQKESSSNSMEEIEFEHAIFEQIYNLFESGYPVVKYNNATLILTSELDNIIPQNIGKDLKIIFPNAEYESVCIAGHFGLSQRYKEFNKKISLFLKRHKLISV